MSTQDNKALIRRYYDELNRKSFAAYDELVAPDVTYNGAAVGRDGMRQFSIMVRTTFPDLRVTVDEMVAEGDLVATYFTWAGTHLAELQSPALGRVAPTNKSFRAKGMDLYRIRAGQIAEIRDSVDRLSMYQQLGVPTSPQQ
ncbi:MAG: ester cyclase [Chloroflexi bacterium]|nr:ester cyclase [Chloroflexota bacterium]